MPDFCPFTGKEAFENRRTAMTALVSTRRDNPRYAGAKGRCGGVYQCNATNRDAGCGRWHITHHSHRANPLSPKTPRKQREQR